MDLTHAFLIAKPLIFAMILGMVIGIERLFARKSAAMRTYSMVSMGSALLVVIGSQVLAIFYDASSVNPVQIAGQIVMSVGFLCTGVMIHRGHDQIVGLTTASGLWVASAVGIACGFGLYDLSIVATILTLFIFVVLHFIENKVKEVANEIDPMPIVAEKKKRIKKNV